MIRIFIDPPDTQADLDDINTLTDELPWRLPSDAKLYVPHHPSFRTLRAPENAPPIGGGEGPTELLIVLAGLGSSGVIAASVKAIYECVKAYFQRDANREVTIEKDGNRITIKGHSLPDSKEFLKMFYPEVVAQNVEPESSLLESFSQGNNIRYWLPSDEEDRMVSKS